LQNEPQKTKTSPARRVAFAGLVAALSCVLLYLDYLLPVLKFAPLVASSLLPVALAYEKRYADALLSFAATAVLSGLLFRSPESWPLYVAFFGWYGILREFAASKLGKVLRWAVLAAAFNAAFFALYFLVSELFVNFRVPPYVLIPAAEALFVVFELVFGFCRDYYAARIRRLLFRRG
jgi:hypothetical protein